MDISRLLDDLIAQKRERMAFIQEQAALVTRLLDDLGAYPAFVLRDEGIKGKRACSDGCPIYEYLRAHGVTAPIEVQPLGVSIGDSDWGPENEYVTHPGPVRLFIAHFDGGLLHQDLSLGGCRD